jgi:hypothetical protein
LKKTQNSPELLF